MSTQHTFPSSSVHLLVPLSGNPHRTYWLCRRGQSRRGPCGGGCHRPACQPQHAGHEPVQEPLQDHALATLTHPTQSRLVCLDLCIYHGDEHDWSVSILPLLSLSCWFPSDHVCTPSCTLAAGACVYSLSCANVRSRSAMLKHLCTAAAHEAALAVTAEEGSWLPLLPVNAYGKWSQHSHADCFRHLIPSACCPNKLRLLGPHPHSTYLLAQRVPCK